METTEKACGHRLWGLTIIRVVLGVIFVMHGAHKVIGFEIPGLGGGGGLATTVAEMTKMGMPAALVYMLAFGEFLGGIALIIGFLSRLAALGIVIIMLGAVYFVHWPNGFFLNWALAPNVPHGFEMNLALIGMGLGIVVSGPGCLALDNLLCKKK